MLRREGRGRELKAQRAEFRAGEVNIGNGSRDSYRLSIVFQITQSLFEWRWRKLRDFKELDGG
jgi:hypothetical protein